MERENGVVMNAAWSKAPGYAIPACIHLPRVKKINQMMLAFDLSTCYLVVHRWHALFWSGIFA
jgi:hypothetical protein